MVLRVLTVVVVVVVVTSEPATDATLFFTSTVLPGLKGSSGSMTGAADF
jgi:hypothetical protein